MQHKSIYLRLFAAFSIATIFALTGLGQPPASQIEDWIAEDTAKYGSAGTKTYEIIANQEEVNLMGWAKVTLARAPTLTVIPGKARGYVTDWRGKPLADAYIGIREADGPDSTRQVNVRTDSRGYYEIVVPWPNAEFYAAGYPINYGKGKAVVGLVPVRDRAGKFASAPGVIQDFSLFPYGGAEYNANSGPASTYYGGSIEFSYSTKLSEDSEIQIILAPDGPAIDGISRTFVVRKKIGSGTVFRLSNIPIGKYKITVKYVNGKPLRIKQVDLSAASPFGIRPRNTIREARLLFIPNDTKPAPKPADGWRSVKILVERPRLVK